MKEKKNNKGAPVQAKPKAQASPKPKMPQKKAVAKQAKGENAQKNEVRANKPKIKRQNESNLHAQKSANIQKKQNQQKKAKNASKKEAKKQPPKPKVKIYSLGGLNEIGKNITAFECGNDIIIVDCGIGFPDDDMLGVDLVVPDFTHIQNNIGKVRGIFITHGHEDHIGSLPYFLKT